MGPRNLVLLAMFQKEGKKGHRSCVSCIVLYRSRTGRSAVIYFVAIAYRTVTIT
jgi:hypothetical protein